MDEKKGVLDSFMGVMDKISGPMAKFGNLKAIKAIQEGLVASIGVTITGAIFLLLFVFSAPNYLADGVTILPFLSDYAGQFINVNALTMNMLALYVTVSVAISFGKEYGIDSITSAMSALMGFLILTNAGTLTAALVTDITSESITAKGFTGTTFTALDVTNFGGGGLIVGIMVALLSIYLIHLCYKFNIRIKLPDSVPPAIGNSFSALIPFIITAAVCWFIRTIMNIDLAELFTESLLPLLGAADNCFTYTLFNFLRVCLWGVGLHGDNMINPIATPMTTVWMNQNVQAAVAGAPIPHIWIGNVTRLDQWISSAWPILFYLLTSKKLKHMKPFAITCTAPAIFGIVEPLLYGLPIVLNPYMFIPMIISHTVTSITTYMSYVIGFVGKPYIDTPWCLPAPLIAIVQSGMDFRGLFIIIINFAIGLLIFYPFFKSYEKNEVAKLEQKLNS